MALYRAAAMPIAFKYAEEHADFIRRFGRFPHRNAVIGRVTHVTTGFSGRGGFISDRAPIRAVITGLASSEAIARPRGGRKTAKEELCVAFLRPHCGGGLVMFNATARAQVPPSYPPITPPSSMRAKREASSSSMRPQIATSPIR